MIRFIISLTRLIVVVLVVTLFASCSMGREQLGDSITGSKNVTLQSREISEPFHGIDVSSGLEVVVVQSPTVAVTVEADDNLQDAILTSVDDGILKIRTKQLSFINFKKATITVNMPKINSIECSGGSRVRNENTIISDKLAIRSSSGSNLSINTESDEIVSESSSGSSIKLRGKALKLETSSSSGSRNDASELIANNVESQSSSGSSTSVHAVLSLDADASSGSSISYSGKPTTISRSESSGASISAR